VVCPGMWSFAQAASRCEMWGRLPFPWSYSEKQTLLRGRTLFRDAGRSLCFLFVGDTDLPPWRFPELGLGDGRPGRGNAPSIPGNEPVGLAHPGAATRTAA